MLGGGGDDDALADERERAARSSDKFVARASSVPIAAAALTHSTWLDMCERASEPLPLSLHTATTNHTTIHLTYFR